VRLYWILAIAAVAACERPPSTDQVRDWTPADHDKSEQQNGGGRQPMGSGGGSPQDEQRMVVEIAWQQNCFRCHGPDGHGDGPDGPMVKAPDLTRADWLSTTSDADIAAQIKNGKGLMPKFDLPDETIEGLIARIRAHKSPGAQKAN